MISTQDVVAQSSEDTIIVYNTNKLLLVGKKVSLIVDTNSSLSITNIIKPEFQEKFILNESDIFSASPSGSAYWFKINIINKTNEDIWIETGGSYSIWEVEFFKPDSSGNYLKPIKSGALEPYNSNEYSAEFYSFKIANGNDENVYTVYLKIKSGVSPVIPFYVGSKNSLDNKTNKINFITYLFVGVMISMIFYNLFLFFATKESIYLSYIVFVFANTVCYTFNNNFSLLGDNNWWWNKHISWQFLGDLSTTIFIIHFLNLRRNLPLAFKTYLIVITLDFVLAILNLFGKETVELLEFYMNISLILIITTIITSVYLAVKGSRNAHFFLFSWAFFLFNLIIFLLVINGLIEFNLYTRYSIYLGIGIGTFLFSIALADRLNILKKEKEILLSENLILSKNYNIILENEIAKKTKKLLEENNIKDALISEIHHRVKNNLQMFSSLIYFHLKSITNDNEKIVLKELQVRVNSMAIIHEMLYKKNNISVISLKEYIEELVKNVISFVNPEKPTLKINYDVDEITISLAKSINLGLLISEIITNSIKHAFAATKNPMIDIIIKKNNDKIFFNIKDNGEGINETQSINKLGVRLIKIFSEQLNAKTEIISNCGLEYKFIIDEK